MQACCTHRIAAEDPQIYHDLNLKSLIAQAFKHPNQKSR